MKKNLNDLTNEELWQLFPVIISEHKNCWKEEYAIEEKSLTEKIGEKDIIRINHIGSTAIPDLLAKPTVDILIEIAKDTELSKLIESMQTLGYVYSPQPKNRLLI